MIILPAALSQSRREYAAATPFRVALLVSLVLHAAAIWEFVPKLRLARPHQPEPDARDAQLNVRLAPLPSPPPPTTRPPAEPQARPRPAPPRVAQERPRQPPIALDRPAPVPAAPASRPAEPDLMAYVEARRRARGEPEAPRPARGETDNDRASGIAAANLAPRAQVFGYDPSRGGGVFQVERLTSDYAEFTFLGWNRDVGRRTKQLIEVRKGDASDIRVAVVRRMIAIIRDYDPVEFLWESQRLGRSVTLSSRLADNAGLEEFMMQEFFHSPAAARR